jgi:hypothetical protein
MTALPILGSQQPRVRNVPEGAARSWGPEAVSLARSVGMKLDPGQAAILHDGMSYQANGLWLAPEVVDNEPRQNGKGVILEARALAGVLLVKEPLVIWTAHEFKTAHEGFLRTRSYFDNFDHLRKRVKTIRSSTHATEIVLLGTKGVGIGARIAFLARSGGSGRGFAGVSPLFLDEAFALSLEQVAAVTFATSAHPNPQVWPMSSAPLKDSDVFRETVERGRRGSKLMVYYEWSASGAYKVLLKLVQDNKLLSDDEAETPRGQKLRGQLFEKVAEANRAFGSRIRETSILRELASSGAEQFLRERLGVFQELESGAAINIAAWNELADAMSARDGDIAVAVDVSPERDWAAVGLYGHREDGLGHLQLIRYMAGTAWVVPFLTEVRDQLDPIAIGMARGTYASLREQLKAAGFQRPEDRPIQMVRVEGQSPHPPQRGDLAVLNAGDMAAACGQLIDAVKNQGFRHVPTRQVDAAVEVAKVRVREDSVAWTRPDQTVDITGLVSFTKARWAYYSRIDEIEDYDPTGDLF